MLFSRQGKAERRAVDLHGIIRQILTLRDTQLVLASIRLETELGATVPSVLGNPQQLQQVLLNLVLNAEQAILGSGVGGRRSGDCIRVSTSDPTGTAPGWSWRWPTAAPAFRPRYSRTSSSPSSRRRR
jgi:C4-dicarboxylate-specific signal transduction histidine kinase